MLVRRIEDKRWGGERQKGREDQSPQQDEDTPKISTPRAREL
jgi:hypothetical protein